MYYDLIRSFLLLAWLAYCTVYMAAAVFGWVPWPDQSHADYMIFFAVVTVATIVGMLVRHLWRRYRLDDKVRRLGCRIAAAEKWIEARMDEVAGTEAGRWVHRNFLTRRRDGR